MPEFTPRSMRARAHARKPLGALSPNVAAPTGGAQKPTGAQKPPRAVHPSVARVIGASSIGRTPSREHTKPRIVGAAVPAAQEAPAPHVPAPRNFGARGARKARTSSQPPPPVPAARRASSLRRTTRPSSRRSRASRARRSTTSSRNKNARAALCP